MNPNAANSLIAKPVQIIVERPHRMESPTPDDMRQAPYYYAGTVEGTDGNTVSVGLGLLGTHVFSLDHGGWVSGPSLILDDCRIRDSSLMSLQLPLQPAPPMSPPGWSEAKAGLVNGFGIGRNSGHTTLQR